MEDERSVELLSISEVPKLNVCSMQESPASSPVESAVVFFCLGFPGPVLGLELPKSSGGIRLDGPVGAWVSPLAFTSAAISFLIAPSSSTIVDTSERVDSSARRWRCIRSEYMEGYRAF